jgi:hypothetical protein
MNKIPSLKRQIKKIIIEQAPLFPAGMQFANIMIEDKSLQKFLVPVNSTLGKYQSVGDNSLPFYKPISRYINPDIE